MSKDQLDMFGGRPAPTPASRVRPARVEAELGELGRRLPRALRFGASTWACSGWDGLVYERPLPEALLIREGLGAYAEHPLLRSVLVERSPRLRFDADSLAAWARATPDDFRVVVGADEACLWGRFPEHPRFGEFSGQTNDGFLDAATLMERTITPTLGAMDPARAVVLVTVPGQEPRALGGRRSFPERLQGLLRGLPEQPIPLALELRDHKLLTPALADVLARHQVIPSIGIHPSLPDVATQVELLDPLSRPLVLIRWSMCVHFDYRVAARHYAPYDAIVDEDERARDSVLSLVRRALDAGREVIVLVSNMAEGCAPRSIEALARSLV